MVGPRNGVPLQIADLTQSERDQLRGMRKRKKELIEEIEKIQEELQNVEGASEVARRDYGNDQGLR